MQPFRARCQLLQTSPEAEMPLSAGEMQGFSGTLVRLNDGLELDTPFPAPR